MFRPEHIGGDKQQGNSAKILMDAFDFAISPDGSTALIALADGMGGYQGGEIASQIAVATVADQFRATGSPSGHEFLASAIAVANQRVYETSQTNAALANMGTTLVAALVTETYAWIGWVGDSRCTLFRGDFSCRLTWDHLSLVENQRYSDAGLKANPNVKGANVLSRHLGGETCRPEFNEIAIEPGDRFVLYSDGVSEYFYEDAIALTLQQSPPAIAARRIVDGAVQNFSRDHCSVVVLEVA